MFTSEWGRNCHAGQPPSRNPQFYQVAATSITSHPNKYLNWIPLGKLESEGKSKYITVDQIFEQKQFLFSYFKPKLLDISWSVVPEIGNMGGIPSHLYSAAPVWMVGRGSTSSSDMPYSGQPCDSLGWQMYNSIGLILQFGNDSVRRTHFFLAAILKLLPRNCWRLLAHKHQPAAWPPRTPLNPSSRF